MTTLATIALILSLMFGGAGATVYAAQGSQPDQPLYGLKLASEDARLEWAAQTQTRLELALEFAGRRVEEISARVRAGQDIPASLAARWQNQVETALKLAAGAEDAQLPAELDQVRTQLREQARLLDQLQGSGPAEAELARLRDQLQTRLRLLDEAPADPDGFRSRVRAGNYAGLPDDDQAGNPWTEETPTPGSGYGPGPGTGECDDCTPQGPALQQGGNPWTEDTPTPGSGYGPGPGTGECEDCTPQGGAPDQSGNPWTEDTPEPGSGYGPGPGPQPTDPPANPQPNPGSGSGGSGGNGNGGKP